MDPQVRALVRQAERQLADLSADVHRVCDWQGDVAVLRGLETVAATLVSATRRHAEDLSRRAAGQRRGPAVDS